MTKQEYLDMFESVSEALETEQSVLSIGREFLPDCALAVLDGGDPAPEYWDFLASQIAD